MDIDLLLAGGKLDLPGDGAMTLRRLNAQDAPLLLTMRGEVIAHLADPDWLHEEPDEDSFVQLLLRPSNLAAAVFFGPELVAYTALALPDQTDDLAPFGLSSEIPRHAPVRGCAYVAATMVSDRHRGCGLQNELTAARHVASGRLSRGHLFATAALGNHYSWRNAMRNGYRAVDVLDFMDPKYGRLTRMLLYRNPEAARLQGEHVWLDPFGIDTQRACLDRGLVGVGWRERGGRSEIGYRAQAPLYTRDIPARDLVN